MEGEGVRQVKVALYVRVSDDKLREDGERRQDIERQVEKLRKWASSTGIVIADEDVFRDDGVSAFKDDYQSRPAFVALLRQVRGHHYQRVVIEDLTRWSRRMDDGMRTLKDASDAGCVITSLAESDIDVTTSAGWMKATLFLMMAEWASRIQSEKVKSGMLRRANDGRCFCKSCGVIHLGRHPDSCGCLKCLKKRGGVKNQFASASNAVPPP